jgi:dolichyl-phosphate-mannose--protein O-mannosyl transferase
MESIKENFNKSFVILLAILFLLISYMVYDHTETHEQEITITQKNINKWYPTGRVICAYVFTDGNSEWWLNTDNPKQDYESLEIGKTYLFVTNNRLGIEKLIKEK